jgi:UDP:flavonoid glycosyltransferase YjiC (YdhE family)
VPPILFCDREEWLPREAARARLGLDLDRPAVLLQLGAGNNQVLHPIIDHMLSVLARLGPYQVVIAEWVIADHVLDSWPGVKVLRDFPNAKFLPAFDFVVSASGYNTFHEMMAGGIPTVFVPSENQETDDQLGRALFAQEEGLGLCVRVSEIEGFEEAVVALADPATRMRIAESCRRRWPENGARAAAERIADLIQDYDGGRTTAAGSSPADGVSS